MTAAWPTLQTQSEGVCLDGTPPSAASRADQRRTDHGHAVEPRPSLEQLWASDDTVWLLPGYAFDAKDGGIYSVLAVEDQYIEVTEPAAVAVRLSTQPGRRLRRLLRSPPTTMLLPGCGVRPSRWSA